jgi:hypothetical protein
MDAGHIMVAVLTTAAMGLAMWAEIHSRRNQAAQNTSGSTEAAESMPTEQTRDELSQLIQTCDSREPGPTPEPRESLPVPV